MIILQNPKYVENLAGAVRAAACFDYGPVLWTGSRIKYPKAQEMIHKSAGHAITKRERTLREFRHKDYQSILWQNTDRPFDLAHFTRYGFIPVCVEVNGAEDLSLFEHPKNAAYVFGPEDGSVDQIFRRLCHRFVRIPSKYCLNLACAVNVVLADRAMKNIRQNINAFR